MKASEEDNTGRKAQSFFLSLQWLQNKFQN